MAPFLRRAVGLCILVLGASSAYAKRAHLREVRRQEQPHHADVVSTTQKPKQNNPIKEFGNEMEDIAQDHILQPLMDGIHVFRMMMCWDRPDLLAHKKCMTYMVRHCAKGRSGKGYCQKLRGLLTRACAKPDERAPPYALKLGMQCAVRDEVKAHEAMKEMDAFTGDDEDPNAEDETANATAAGPAPAPASAPGPAPLPGPAPGPVPMITDLDKTLRPLPNQGFNEVYDGNNTIVMHENMKTLTTDWHKEWPRYHETEGETRERICKEQPDHDWCKLYLKDRARGQASMNGFKFDPSAKLPHEHIDLDAPSHEEVDQHIEETDRAANRAVFKRRPHSNPKWEDTKD